ncbi:uncharacterized protein LOC121547363 isoform X1 [Coregonus clupeaformis]|uniref:uncharacterized protein LOC121547363 isoform X1 n=1 Tax=Coregonus clupeaformis TaxID=59861 RepID=UPI001E1C37D3|nr:uncharacterized protein LOC121547363 isoform X1 [Coregonus clupeaformis]
MMWSLWILLGTLSVDGYAVHDLHERLSHGRQLKIYLPKSSSKLEFTPAAEPMKTYLYWDRGARTTKGRVSGTGTDRRWYLDKVTYEDQGTYVQTDHWNKEISSLKVAVNTRREYPKCVAGEDLYISLEGIDLADAQLSFSGADANVSLVHDGAVVAQDHPDYWNRVKTYSTKITIENVNTTDVGYYMLRDRRDRVVSIIRMELTDHHDYEAANPLMALLLLLGIPAGICCCCQKKIFKKKAPHTTAILQGTPETLHPPPGYNIPGGVSPGPGGPVFYHGPGPDPNMGGYPQLYSPPNPGMPGQPQWTGPPFQPGFNPGYPPQDPMYPPTQPLQWNGPPPNQPQHNPGAPPMWSGPPNQYQYPVAPMGYAPVMYSAPPPGEPVKEEIKMENMSPANPLLAHPPQPPQASSPYAPMPAPASDVLHSSDGAYQFNIDTGKNTTTNATNFL